VSLVYVEINLFSLALFKGSLFEESAKDKSWVRSTAVVTAELVFLILFSAPPQFSLVPFSLNWNLATFQRLIESLLRQHCEHLAAYLNGVPVSSE